MNIIIIIVVIIFIIILYCYYYLNTSRCSSLFRCSGVLVFRCFCVAACSSVFRPVSACSGVPDVYSFIIHSMSVFEANEAVFRVS